MRGWQWTGPVVLAVLVLLTVATWSYVFLHEPGGSSADPVASVASSGPAAAAPASDGRSVVVVGDGWTDPRTQAGGSFLSVAAERLDWQARVVEDGSGTGYLSRGPSEAGTYAERLRAQDPDPEVDLVVLQGGSADESILAANPTIPVDAAVRRTLAVAHRQYAGAQVLVLAPIATPGSGGAVRTIDRTLGRVGHAAGASYVSPLRRGWLTDAATSLDEATGLPNALGRARLADRFVAAVDDLPDA